MEEKDIIEEITELEIACLNAENESLQKKIVEIKTIKEHENRFCAIFKKHTGHAITHIQEVKHYSVSQNIWHTILDEAFGIPGNLIQPSHHFLKYSLINKKPELKEHIPSQGLLSVLDLLGGKSAVRAFEIIHEYTSENTRLAYLGDLVYWQAWLSAIGFSFNETITEKEIITFIIQHIEGLDVDIDKKLVEQGYKSKLGPHRLSTIKRRIASLSVFVDSVKWLNPCRNKSILVLLQKLTKKYGGSKPSGKAITKDILDDMLDTCRSTLKDIRDKALLLFAWASGGRRRSEVASADIKDLTKTEYGDFVYNIPESKTDQEGKGHPVPVKGRAARALNDWLKASGINEGALFRSIKKGGKIVGALSPLDVNRIVKNRLKKAGYDEQHFGAHSLRSGFVTEAGRRGKNLGDVMQMTTHRNIGTVMKYYQAGNVINNSASNLAD